MRRKLLSCRTTQSQLSNGLRESFSHASSGASVGSIIQRLLEAMVAGCCEQRAGLTRHGLPSFRCNAPLTACLKRASRTVSVLTLSGRLTRLLTSLVTVAHQQQPFSPGQGLGKSAPRGK
jgi:hypothetical protein